METETNKKGIIVLPKAIREEPGLKEGDVVKVEGSRIIIEKVDLWDKVCCKGSAEEAEK